VSSNKNNLSVSVYQPNSPVTYAKPTNLLNVHVSPVKSVSELIANNGFYSSLSSYTSQTPTINTVGMYPLSVESVSSNINSKSTPLVTRVGKLSRSYTPLRLLLTKSNSLTGVFSESSFIKKPVNNNLFLVIKQKRFSSPNFNKSGLIFKNVSYDYYKEDIKSLSAYANEYFNITDVKNAINNKRLLRTRRILVLPTKTNITLITNSFDVMHSWFVPGLGIKIDCVPGRSTHHTIHIDHTGFYYGQCAEICGRYHHHMPIRICSLPFNHFILWW